jgi:hypothetical protein
MVLPLGMLGTELTLARLGQMDWGIRFLKGSMVWEVWGKLDGYSE